MGMWSSAAFGFMSPRASYQVTWLPEEHVKGQMTNLGFWRHDFAASYPIWQDDENEWSGSASVRSEFLHTGAILPNTELPFPDELWNIRVGGSYRHLFENGWIAGGNVNVGSASDRPFNTIEEADVSASAFLRIPQGERNAWLLSLNFSTNSQVLNYIPIPGVAFFWNPSPLFQATIGFPFANIVWRPTEDWMFQLNYALLTNVHGRIAYRIAPGLFVYAAYGAGSESYYLAERTDPKERFFYNDQRVFGGVQWRFLRNWTLDLSGGYSFDRSYFEGRNYGNHQQDQVGVGNAPYVSLKVQTRF